jgi:hypothetical protein
MFEQRDPHGFARPRHIALLPVALAPLNIA